MMRLLSFLMIVSFVSAFAPAQRTWGTLSRVTTTTTIAVTPPTTRSPTTTSNSRLHMFSVDDNNNGSAQPLVSSSVAPLETIDGSAPSVVTSAVEEKPVVRNVVKDMNTGEIKEVKWVDPAMRANTRPWEMSWWAYIGFGFPFVLLADDAFHFLPEDGPLGFFGRM